MFESLYFQQKVEGLICYDPMWWGSGELGARLNPRNHKPVRMFNARNHRGVSSKMLVKRWSSNTSFVKVLHLSKKTWILLRYTSNTWWFQKIPQHHFHSKLEILTRYTQIPLILKGTWLEPWANGTPWGRASRQSVEKLSFQCLWKMPEV